MNNEEQFREMIFKQLEELEQQCLLEKKKIKKTMREMIIYDFRKSYKELSALSARIIMIEFALFQYKNKERLLI
jgi:hypothetical protein